MSDSSNERLNNGEFHLKEINRCREVFMETDSESEREFHAHLALDAFGHLLRETCGWALQYRLGLTYLWSQDILPDNLEQVKEAAKDSRIQDPAIARAFLANLFDAFGNGLSLFAQLGKELTELEWGVVGPVLTPAKTKQPEDRRMEWSFRLRALLHLEYLCGLEGYGSRENAIGAVEGAFGLEGETLLDWTKKGKHPTQILRRNFEFHQARARYNRVNMNMTLRISRTEIGGREIHEVRFVPNTLSNFIEACMVEEAAAALMIRYCTICGKPFQIGQRQGGLRTNRKTCSDACRAKRSWKKRAQN
ncbi:MAG: hypothetical protein VCE91_17375 [Nitrospinota bacterium]